MDGLVAFLHQFSTPEVCLSYLESVRWKRGNFCVKCGLREKSNEVRKKCKTCQKEFYITTGTIFGDSPIKMLPQWFATIWIDTNHSKGISSVQLSKLIGVMELSRFYGQIPLFRPLLLHDRLLPFHWYEINLDPLIQCDRDSLKHRK